MLLPAAATCTRSFDAGLASTAPTGTSDAGTAHPAQAAAMHRIRARRGSVMPVISGRSGKCVSSRSRGHDIDHDIDGEAGVVFTLETLVAPVVVPLASIILVAVQHAEPGA